MERLRSKKAIVVASIAAFVLGGASVALAAALVVTDTNTVRLRIVQSDFAVFDSGWHTHPGLVVVQVQKGQLKITQGGSCTSTLVNAGDTYIEVPLVPVRAVAQGDTNWTTSLILPNLVGAPAQTTVPDPCVGEGENQENDGQHP